MKKKDLYLDNGYLNVDNLYASKYPFIFVIGGRGIGKTYGFLKKMYEDGINFMFLRRTQAQADVICTPDFNPYKALNVDMGWHIYPKKLTKYTFGFFEGYLEDGKIEIDKYTQIATGGALSTFSNIRGFDASDLDVLIYDEFIPQINERAMKGEADSFFNMLETVNRNRELKGIPPLKVICLSNSTDVANPIFIELGIVTKLMRLKTKGEFIYENPERKLTVIMPKDSPISEAKKDTALYQFAQGTSFYESSIGNEFTYNAFTSVKSKPLSEYNPMVTAGEITIYRHKSNGRLYVSGHKSGNMPVYKCNAKELTLFRHKYLHLMQYAYADRIDYEDYTAEVLFDKYMQIY